VCPTAALLMQGGADAPALTLDDGRCVACGHCVESCPERVISVERRITPETVAGRRVLKQGEAGRCRRCGEPVAPTAMLERIRELLPDGSPELLDVLTGLCLDCRGR
jgi:Fe-S-cluster-containing hydrogenase component 2